MNKIPGIRKPDLQALPQLRARITFLYIEHCKISREANAITVTDKEGITHIPAASVCAILLGPGTSISHQAMELIAEVGVTVVWVGENGARYYASGRPMTHSSALLLRQAEMAANTRLHLQVARKMYEMRFPEEDVSGLTMQQLRGREGSRIRRVYRNCSKRWHVEWNGREYRPDNYEEGTPVNQALSAGHACLYGLAHAVICALGCSPGLGFVHVGHENSFVYDMADLYKAEVTIPAAFEIASSVPDDIGSATRRLVRDRMVEAHILERMIKDIHDILMTGEENEPFSDEVHLWNGKAELLRNGINYGGPDSEEEQPFL